MQRIKKLGILARAIALDEDALICDFAEYYHILNYKDFNPRLVGVLFCGLSDNSRIKMKMSGTKASSELILLANIADSLATLVWFNSKDGQENINRPKSLLKAVLQIEEEKEATELFTTGEDFEKKRKELLKGIQNG